MNKRTIGNIVPAIFFCSVLATPLFAQQKAPLQQKPQVKTEVKADDSAASCYLSTSGAIFTIGGGYYSALGDMGKILKPSWAAMLSASYNNLGDTLFGVGIDGSYAALNDKSVSGGIIYTTVHPHVTAAFSVSNWFDVVLKGGPGFSVLTSTINGSANPSLTFTLGGGGGIARVFGTHFVMGMECDYYYFLQRESSSSAAAYFYMGYKM